MARKMKTGAIPPAPTETPPAEQVEALEQAKADIAASPAAKRRGRPRNPAPPTNVTDETIREHCQKAARHFGELQTAREGVSVAMGTYRAALKEAKKAGVPTQAIIWYLAARSRDPEEIDRETRERNRIAKVMALPIGHQLGLFDDGETVAHKVDQDKLKAQAAGRLPDDAYSEGVLAGKDGKPITVNPYPLDSAAFDQFEKGWGEGQASIVFAAAAGGNGSAAHA